MRVAIAGAGNVGRSVANELVENGHDVLLLEKEPKAVKPGSVVGAEWLLGDACEVAQLEKARLDGYDVVIAATGDDKVNLVVSLLAKTEFVVPRVVARVNHPKNEWLFTEAWGVDVSVSTPRLISALIEEAVTVGDLVRLMTFEQGKAGLVELTLGPDSPIIGRTIEGVPWPNDSAPVAILRAGRVIMPQPNLPLQAGDEVMVITTAEVEPQLEALLTMPSAPEPPAAQD
jgi:trk system potassium uptake protein TrkA